MGLFAKRRFMPTEIITIYFALKKTRVEPKSKTYTIHCSGFYYSITNHNVPLFMGAHYMNDETWKCKEADKKYLMKKKNAQLNGFRVVATGRIEAGIEIKITYY